jgi:hypothetical protein
MVTPVLRSSSERIGATARDMNHFAFVDLRDRYGITQVVFYNPGEGDAAKADPTMLKNYQAACGLGREFVIQIEGKVIERSNKHRNRPTGEVEVVCETLVVLNAGDVLTCKTVLLMPCRLCSGSLEDRRPWAALLGTLPDLDVSIRGAARLAWL